MRMPNSCKAGTYETSPGVCTQCTAGNYCPSNGMDSQTQCTAGNYCPSNGMTSQTPCTVCTGRTYETTACTSTTNRVCSPCSKPAGTYYNSINGCSTSACYSASCPAVANGTPYLPSGSCVDADQSQPSGWSGAGSCNVTCDTGYQQAGYFCMKLQNICPAGSYGADTVCNECPSGTYSFDPGWSKCLPSPANSVINSTRTGWTCAAGYRGVSYNIKYPMTENPVQCIV